MLRKGDAIGRGILRESGLGKRLRLGFTKVLTVQ
jgi:hypothetical protein